MTAREIPACAARDTASTTSPPAELLLVDVLGLFEAAGAPDEVPGREEVDSLRVVGVVPLVVDDPVVEGVTDDVPLTDVDVTGLVLLLPPGRYDGAGTAVDGSVSAPVPQGIG